MQKKRLTRRNHLISVSIPALQQGKSLKEVTTFGIGGPANYYVEIRTVEEMQGLILQCKEENLAYFILGKGSNTLFDDRGFAGLIIHNKIDFKTEKEPGIFYVGAGYNFSLLGSQTAREGWSGLEFASGIPGSVGGAIFMNAGANGQETCQSLSAVEYIAEDGTHQWLEKKDLHFAYRTSPFQKLKGSIVGGLFSLTPSTEARQKQIDIIHYRKKTQPLNEKSAGCIFRNPNCGHAGALIEKSSLKGIQVGGAKISEVHANFIVNAENAKAMDVLKLIQHVKEQVKAQTGVDLESEVRYIPYEPGEL